MPFDLEAEIARRLRVDPETIGPALNAVIERIRQQVSHFGYARVAGLGTFRGHNGHLAFEPEPVLADEVNARFAGLDVLDVAPARDAHDDEDVVPHDTPDEDAETHYGPSPGDDYERHDAALEDEEEREDADREDADADREGSDADTAARSEEIADAHATITPVYEKEGGADAPYDLETSTANQDDEWPADAAEPAFWEARSEASPVELQEDERADDSSEGYGWGDQAGDAEVADRGVEEEPRESEDEEWPLEENAPGAEGIPAAGWTEETPVWEEDDERFSEGFKSVDAESTAEEWSEQEGDDAGFAGVAPAEAEPAEFEPAGGELADVEPADYESAEGELPEYRSAEYEEPEEATASRSGVVWDPPEERSEADLYAEEEAAMAAGAIGGAAADAGDETGVVEEAEDFSEVGDGEEPTAQDEYVALDDEADEHIAGESQRDASLQPAPDRAALPHEASGESADRRRTVSSAATSDAVAGRRSAVLISIGIVVLLAAAAVIYFATSSTPIDEATGPGLATPAAEDTSAAAASADAGTATADTTDLAVTTPPAEPAPVPPATQTPLDPLRGSEPIDRAAGGYTLVVFSDFSDSNANTVAGTYRDQGFRTGVLDDQDGGRTRFRVAVGQFSTLDEAVEARDRLAGNGLPEDAWVRRIQ